jgi:hypothetical protein
MKCSEFINEVAHYHFSHDADVTADLTRENGLRKEFRKLKKRKRIASRLLAVANEEGRLDQKITIDLIKGNIGPHPAEPLLEDADALLASAVQTGGAESPKSVVPEKK